MALTLVSPAFGQGEEIPKRYTCDGEGISPPLAWQGVPEGARSLLLVCDDPDAPGEVFHHWAAYEIPVDWTRLDEGFGAETLASGIRQAINDFGNPGYGGPCPPQGHGRHRYHFRLSALALAIGSGIAVGLGGKDYVADNIARWLRGTPLSAAPSASCLEVIRLARPHIIEFVELVGLYGR